VTFQSGATGVLQVTAPGVYTLTAAYTDHGSIKAKAGPYLTGLDRITLTVK
jgi:hypothetical protein